MHMTLVVCRIHEEELFIQSDTRVLDDYGVGAERFLSQNQPLLRGLLKTVILHPHICLSFAGQSQVATDFLENFMAEELSEWSTERLIKELLDIHIKSDEECEFILCMAINRSPIILSIKNGVVNNTPNAWIGSKPAFEVYQKAFHEQDESIPLKQRMRSAFDSVILDPNIAEVGHFHIEAYLDHHIETQDSVFLYELKTSIDAGSQKITIKANSNTAIPLGEATYGAYGVSYFRSISPQIHGIAIHFPHANMGVLLCPQVDCKRPVFYKDLTAHTFLSQIWNDHHIAMEGMAMISKTKIQFIRSPVDDNHLNKKHE